MHGSTVALSISASSAGADPERPARQAGRLKPREVLRYLSRVAELPVEARDDGALTDIVRSAVPTLADEASLFVVASDGRLHRAAQASRMTVQSGPEAGELLARDSPHPAVAATRLSTLTYLHEGTTVPLAYTRDEPVAEGSLTGIRSVAVPISTS
jgi:hypothetical protein